jgi:hypothetical protein
MLRRCGLGVMMVGAAPVGDACSVPVRRMLMRMLHRTGWVNVLVGLALGISLTLAAPAPAQASTTWTVTGLTDPASICNPTTHNCPSLRAALTAAGSGDTVVFAAGLNGTLTLAGTELAPTSDLTITGPGAGVVTVNAGGSSRVLRVAAGRAVTVTGLTLANGHAPAAEVCHDVTTACGAACSSRSER